MIKISNSSLRLFFQEVTGIWTSLWMAATANKASLPSIKPPIPAFYFGIKHFLNWVLFLNNQLVQCNNMDLTFAWLHYLLKSKALLTIVINFLQEKLMNVFRNNRMSFLCSLLVFLFILFIYLLHIVIQLCHCIFI